jgi:hypothetical protein
MSAIHVEKEMEEEKQEICVIAEDNATGIIEETVVVKPERKQKREYVHPRVASKLAELQGRGLLNDKGGLTKPPKAMVVRD